MARFVLQQTPSRQRTSIGFLEIGADGTSRGKKETTHDD